MKLCVLVPAYKCESIIDEVCRRIPLPGPEDEIIVVDDCSPDNTSAVARSVPRVCVYRNPANLGYGGTSHRLYELAYERGADLTVNIHGDLGHKPEEIPLLLDEFKNGQPDIVVGSRLLYLLQNARNVGWLKMFTDGTARAGMPLERFMGHVVLTEVQNLAYRSRLHSFHEGMRACHRSVVEWVVKTRFPAWYNYDNELLFQAHKHRFKIKEVPVPPSYDPRAQTASPPYKYGWSVLKHILRVAVTGK